MLLRLTLKKKWFEMIKSGVKKEEYRDLKPYWKSRLGTTFLFPWLGYTEVEFTLGYPKKGTGQRLHFKGLEIKIGEGKEEWGAEKGKKYFVLKWSENNGSERN